MSAKAEFEFSIWPRTSSINSASTWLPKRLLSNVFTKLSQLIGGRDFDVEVRQPSESVSIKNLKSSAHFESFESSAFEIRNDSLVNTFSKLWLSK